MNIHFFNNLVVIHPYVLITMHCTVGLLQTDTYTQSTSRRLVDSNVQYCPDFSFVYIGLTTEVRRFLQLILKTLFFRLSSGWKY